MPSGEERMMILRMVEDGKVTPEEGARLLAALGQPEPVAQPANGDAAGWAASVDTRGKAAQIRASCEQVVSSVASETPARTDHHP